MNEEWINELSDLFFKPSIELSDIDAVIALKYKNIPKRIYKYRKVSEYSIQNLLDDTVWCSNASDFNDPYDSSLCFDFDKIINESLIDSAQTYLKDLDEFQLNEDVLNEMRNSSDPYRTIIQQGASATKTEIDSKMEEQILQVIHNVTQKNIVEMNKQFNNGLQNGYKICSFSERIDSILMWSHYTDYHKGFSVEYDFSGLDITDVRTRFLWPVIYNDNLFDASSFFEEQKRSGKFNNLFGIIASIHKAKDWEYEYEWRMIVPMSPSDPPMNFSVPKPIAIYLGSKMEEKRRKEFISIAQKKNISIYEMKLAYNRFKMIPEVIK